MRQSLKPIALFLLFNAALCQVLVAQISEGTWQFRVQAVGVEDKVVATSNTLSIAEEYKVFIPNAFTPNGDGVNDSFAIKGRSIKAYYLSVYHRSGQLIFSSSSPSQGWDGKYEGQPVSTGAYAYKVRLETLEGLPISKSGSLIVMR